MCVHSLLGTHGATTGRRVLLCTRHVHLPMNISIRLELALRPNACRLDRLPSEQAFAHEHALLLAHPVGRRIDLVIVEVRAAEDVERERTRAGDGGVAVRVRQRMADDGAEVGFIQLLQRRVWIADDTHLGRAELSIDHALLA